MREALDQLALEISPGALFNRPPTVRFRPERTACDCGARLLVYNTRKKNVFSMIGPFVAHETRLCCGQCGKVYGSEKLTEIVAPSCNVAYDLLVFVGRALFQRYRTVEEVLGELALRNVYISASEVSYLGRKFIDYLGRAHGQAVPQIREAMRLAGGYVLHLDAMHAGKAPALMTGLDGLSHIVLGNTKLPSESAESIVPFLEELEDRFGTPLACVHDMGRGICAAVTQVFSGVPDFICHFHFLRDVGKDLLEPSYACLRKRLRKHAVSGRLHALVRQLASELAARSADCTVLAQAIRGAEPPADPELVPAVVAYALGQWVLKGKHLGNGYGFPFDRPLLDFAERLLQLLEHLPAFVDVLLRDDWRDNKPLYKLSRELSRADDDAELRRALVQLRWRCKLFDSLRAAMRIAPPNGTKGLNDAGEVRNMRTIRRRVLAYREKLQCDPKLSADPLCTKMAEQIDKYAEKLFADPITVTTTHGPVTIQPQRTNNILEQFFRGLRRGHRRRTGNDCMSRALQAMLADTPLVKNLDNDAYITMLLGDNQTLEKRFAELDAEACGHGKNEELEKNTKLPEFTSLTRIKKLPQLVAKLFKSSTAGVESN